MRCNKLKAEIEHLRATGMQKKVFKNCVVFLNIGMKTGESLNINDFRL